jgi:hypothetical protein
VPGEDPSVISGDHRLNGVLLMQGPVTAAGSQVKQANIMDLAPTILFTMGLPIPRGMDGRVLTESFAADFLSGNEPRFESGASSDDSPSAGAGYDEEEEETIYRRLRDLGYVE